MVVKVVKARIEWPTVKKFSEGLYTKSNTCCVIFKTWGKNYFYIIGDRTAIALSYTRNLWWFKVWLYTSFYIRCSYCCDGSEPHIGSTTLSSSSQTQYILQSFPWSYTMLLHSFSLSLNPIMLLFFSILVCLVRLHGSLHLVSLPCLLDRRSMEWIRPSDTY